MRIFSKILVLAILVVSSRLAYAGGVSFSSSGNNSATATALAANGVD